MFYNKTSEEVIKQFNSDGKVGLTDQQVKLNQEKYGMNIIPTEKKKPWIIRFLLQFKDTLTIILILAAIISVIVEPEEFVESIIIVVVVILNAILGIIQESNAEKALEALQEMSSPKAKVIRNGKKQTVDSKEVVPGDLLVIEAGDTVVSDARLVEAYNLKIDESALTGESVPVDKVDTVLEGTDIALGDRTNMIYSSCNATYGRGVAVVTSNGKDNEVGKIATMLSFTKKEQTPLQDRLDQIGKTIGIMVIVICIVVFAMEVMSGLSIIDAFKTSIALAVAAIPEGLATVVTVVLALSVQRMVKKHAIVKSLPAVETLGSTSIVCSDKTGTLTQNKMTVVKTFTLTTGLKDIEKQNKDIDEMLNYFTLCSDGVIGEDGKGIGDPTELALVQSSLDHGYASEDLNAKYPRLKELAFDSKRKMMTVFIEKDGQIMSITKGGPDVIFDRCLDIQRVMDQINTQMSKKALRVLAVGIKLWDELPTDMSSEKVEKDLNFIGLVGMIDPERKEAKQAVLEAKRAGVRTIMITGDHIVTASAIAKNLGILEPGQTAIMGNDLNEMSDVELIENIEKYSVYARVAPEHKVRIVNAWQAKNKVVAMTGDGVNDSPALKAADIGCAMGITGTDVAKGAASMILTDDNFATIITSIKEGRGIYDNVKKDVQFLLSGNIGEVIVIFLASIFSVIFSLHGQTPLLPIHLLWVNLITDSLPAFALGFEPTEQDVMERKPRDKDESFFAGGLGFKIVWQGIMIGGLTLTAYYIGNSIDHGIGMTMAFITLCASELIHAFNVKTSKSILSKELFTNKYLFGSLIIGTLLQVVIIVIEPLRKMFKLELLSWQQLLICIGLGLLTVVFSEIEKKFVKSQ